MPGGGTGAGGGRGAESGLCRCSRLSASTFHFTSSMLMDCYVRRLLYSKCQSFYKLQNGLRVRTRFNCVGINRSVVQSERVEARAARGQRVAPAHNGSRQALCARRCYYAD